MKVANRVVSAVLRSPAHRVLSGAVDVIRYTGRRSGRRFSTPTQYARRGDEVIILVGHPEAKRWWRNFRDDRDIDVLLERRWVPMRARAVIGADEPEVATPLLDAYLERFPKAARTLNGDGDGAGDRVRHAVLVRCRPR